MWLQTPAILMVSYCIQIALFPTIPDRAHHFTAISRYLPTDATTNPSLLLAAAQMDEYKDLIQNALEYGEKSGG